MHPVLFEFTISGQLVQIPSYVFFALLGFLTAWILILMQVRPPVPKAPTAIAVLSLSAALVIGSRLFYAMHNPMQFSSVRSVLHPSTKGFAIYGGLILTTVISPFLLRALKLNPARFWDISAAPVAVGLALGRVGCFMAGCCFGKPSDVPWAVQFPWGSQPHRWQMLHTGGGLFSVPLPVHPTQLYEVAALLGIAAVSWYTLKTGRFANGTAAVLAALGYSAFRLLNLLFRADPAGSLPLWLYPVIYVGIITVSLCWLLRNRPEQLKNKEDV